jgi:3'(2'), 5'-bisphosphate nucleotidase
VNIALIDHGVPVFGIIHAPVSGITWHATAGQGAYRIENGIETRIHMAAADAQSLRLLAGKRSAEPVVLEPFVGPHAVVDRKLRSSSLKFCLIAEGAADLYPRLIQTFEWDTAAGDIIVREAGGAVLDLATRLPMIYGKQHLGFENNGFIAGSRTLFKNIVIPAQAGIHGKE